MTSSSSLMAEIATGLEQGQFALAYQPIVDAATHQVRGAEALLRWSHPKFGQLSPGSFRDAVLASADGTQWNLTRFVIDTVCADVAAQANGLEGGAASCFVSFNVAPDLMAGDALTTWIQSCCKRHGIAPGRLVVEILEDETSIPLPCLNEVLSAIKNQGARIALDDFGTGCSSLERLAALKVDIVKLPRELICNVHTSQRDSLIAASLIQLLRKLKIEVIAEGVENIEQLQWLRQQRVSCVQGFYFSKPMPSLTTALQSSQ